jgi:hypothetical protein
MNRCLYLSVVVSGNSLCYYTYITSPRSWLAKYLLDTACLEIRLLSFVIECSCMFVVQVSEPSSFFTPDGGTSSKLGYLL